MKPSTWLCYIYFYVQIANGQYKEYLVGQLTAEIFWVGQGICLAWHSVAWWDQIPWRDLIASDWVFAGNLLWMFFKWSFFWTKLILIETCSSPRRNPQSQLWPWLVSQFLNWLNFLTASLFSWKYTEEPTRGSIRWIISRKQKTGKNLKTKLMMNLRKLFSFR